ncbi:hypothetical protein AABM38_10735 [Heyndrickxia sp. MSNUG]
MELDEIERDLFLNELRKLDEEFKRCEDKYLKDLIFEHMLLIVMVLTEK